MRDELDRIRGKGAELLLVGNGSRYFAAAFREDFALDVPVLIDPELRAYRAAGLRRGRVEALSPRMPLNALRALRRGSRQTGVQGDPWQLGGVFVLQPGGELTFAHTSREAGDHPDLESILAALEPTASPIREESTSTTQRVLGEALSRLVDPLVVPSFDRTGFRIHSLRFDPGDLAVDLSSRRCVVTGGNSGIGFESARTFADLGAEVILACRDRGRGEAAAESIREDTGNSRVRVEVVDVSDLQSVRSGASALGKEALDILVHNAGVLPEERVATAEGFESTFATHVLGPFLLSSLLRPALEKSADGRMIWVSSGGMYTRRLELDDPNWEARESYDGVTAYAETKRAQVVLAGLWAEKLAGSAVSVFSMHPGWADTPSVETSLPVFYRVTKRFLRTPAEGADTVVWLASPAVQPRSGGFYFDRVERSQYWLPGTRESESERSRLWEMCERLTHDGESGT